MSFSRRAAEEREREDGEEGPEKQFERYEEETDVRVALDSRCLHEVGASWPKTERIFLLFVSSWSVEGGESSSLSSAKSLEEKEDRQKVERTGRPRLSFSSREDPEAVFLRCTYTWTVAAVIGNTKKKLSGLGSVERRGSRFFLVFCKLSEESFLPKYTVECSGFESKLCMRMRRTGGCTHFFCPPRTDG